MSRPASHSARRATAVRRRGIAWPRLLAVTVLAIVAAFAAPLFLASYWTSAAQEEMEHDVLIHMLGPAATHSAAADLVDSDGDLVADAPPDDQCTSPDEFVLSYVAAQPSDDVGDAWGEVVEALAQRLGKPVKYVHYTDTTDQLNALREGKVHIVGLSTGTVPLAVRHYGFVPICTFGREDGSYGYTMKIIVPSDSSIDSLDKLRGKRITFTQPTSNSGFKAAAVLLMNKYDMLPERDYDWAFSLGHEESIRRVASGDYEAAPIASDILERMVSQGEVRLDQIKSIYQSEPFPPAAIGIAYNLVGPARDAIRQTLFDFDWQDTKLAAEFGPGGQVKFVPVSYQADWRETREVDDTLDAIRGQRRSR